MSKKKDHSDSRQRYKNRRYSCQERHKRTYFYSQFDNYLKHCRGWKCPVLQKKKEEFTSRRVKRISFGDGKLPPIKMGGFPSEID